MKKSPKIKVFVAMSGGVDSSVAAALLKKQGYEVTGVFMKNWSEPVETYSKKKSLCWIDERRDAIRVAAKLGIPLLTFDFEKEYRKQVVDYMFRGYKAGRTPNPDIQCNKLIKFPLFLKRVLKMSAPACRQAGIFIATGHYIKLKTQNLKLKTFSKLYQAKDKEKDQSYFLWTLTQDQLKHCLFPIGDYLKSEVRQMAKKMGLQNALKKGTSGICFIGEVNLREFLKKKIKEKTGKIINTEGEVIGRHPGIFFFTIGQRHGLGIAGEKPYYVADKDVKNNVLIVAEGKNNPALYKKETELKEVNFINAEMAAVKRQSVLARVRYRQPLSQATLYKKDLPAPCLRMQEAGKKYRLVFRKPQKFVAPGQSAVFYSKNGEMLGGGIIV